METWIAITVAAAFAQNIRSTLQKHLKSKMGTTGATFVRFGFGVPFAIAIIVGLAQSGRAIPAPNATFITWILVAASAQILAQALLVHLFSFRNFAVGTAYSRTEPAQAALFALALTGEGVSAGTVIAIAISVCGVMLISVAGVARNLRALLGSLVSRTALIGLASGTAFGIAAVGYRAASLALLDNMAAPDFLVQGATVLLWAICLQSAAMMAWMMWRDPAELIRIRSAWKIAAVVGFVGATASFGWFTAMTLQKAAVVKALAQIEMLFTFASTVFFFRERISYIEAAGCVLISVGIVWLVLAG